VGGTTTLGHFAWDLGDGLELRLWALEDAERLAALIQANQEHLHPWLPFATADYSATDAEEFIRRAMRQYADGLGVQCAIVHEGALAGSVGLHAIDWPNAMTSIGYWIAKPFEGKGLVTRSVRALIDHAFGELGLSRLEIRAEPDNQRSRAVPERLGFREEGTLRHVVVWAGVRYVDHVVYGLLAEEWHG